MPKTLIRLSAHLRELVFSILVLGAFQAADAQNYDGMPDGSFGRAGGFASTYLGYLETSSPYFSPYIAMAMQPDGKFIAASTFGQGNDTPVVLRINNDGSEDQTFGNSGLLAISTFRAPYLAPDGERLSAIVPNNGTILTAGSAEAAGTTYGFVARLLSNGQVDTNFAVGGYLIGPHYLGVGTPSRISLFNALAVLPDSTIVVAGRVSDVDPITAAVGPSAFYVAHYSSTGTSLLAERRISFDFDDGFGDFVVRPSEALALAVSADSQRLVVVGTEQEIQAADTNCAIAVFKLPDLSLDGAWNSSGNPFVPLGQSILPFDSHFSSFSADRCNAVAVQLDGKVVIGGESRLPPIQNEEQTSFWSVMRLNSDGSPDTLFTADDATHQRVGKYLPGVLSGFNSINSLVLQYDGKIVFGGYAANNVADYFPADFGFGRLTKNGDLDSSFGNNGSSVFGSSREDMFPGDHTGSAQFVTGMVLDANRPVGVGVDFAYPDTAGVAGFLFRRLQNDGIFGDGFGQ